MAKRYLNNEDGVEISKSVSYNDSAILTPTPLAANVNDYNPTDFKDVEGNIVVTILRLQTNGSGVKTITGLSAPNPFTGNIVVIINIGSQNIIISNNNAASSAQNRFLLNANATLAANEASSFIYDEISQRWRQMNDYQ